MQVHDDANEGYLEVGGADSSSAAADAASAEAERSVNVAQAAGAPTPPLPSPTTAEPSTPPRSQVTARTSAAVPTRVSPPRHEDAALAFVNARAAAAKSGAASAMVHSGHAFAQFNNTGSPKADKKYASVRFKTLRQRQRLAMSEAFGGAEEAAEAGEEKAAPSTSSPATARSRKALPTSWTNSLRRKKKTGTADGGAALSCCALVPPGLSYCETCGISW